MDFKWIKFSENYLDRTITWIGKQMVRTWPEANVDDPIRVNVWNDLKSLALIGPLDQGVIAGDRVDELIVTCDPGHY